MKSYIIGIIVLLILATAVLVYGWAVGGWFEAEKYLVVETTLSDAEDFLSDEEIQLLDDQSDADTRLMTEAEETAVAVQLYSLENNAIPENIEILVPDYLPQVYSDIDYRITNENEAIISVSLSEAETELMSSDEGSSPDLYELVITVPGQEILQ